MENPYIILIIIGTLIAFSYVFNLLSNVTKIPSVILLLTTGITLNYIGKEWGFHFLETKFTLEILGIVGLILIVLEGSLELTITKEKLPLILKSFLSSLFTLLSTTGLITCIIFYMLNEPWRLAFVYAIPLGVISSAVAIPSVHNLLESKKEFIVYESTFSDILGIMLFNYAIAENPGSTHSVVTFFSDFFIILIVSAVSSLIMLFMLNYLTSRIKFYLIFAILLLIYSFGKLFHLSSLLLILVFGLILNNSHFIIKGKVAKYLHLEKIQTVNQELQLSTTETAFLIRTFFFIVFGYSLDLNSLLNVQVIGIGLLIVLSILFIRYILLRFISHINLIPELFIAPRGLITIVLFYSIPEKFKIHAFSEGILFFVIICSSLIMMSGLMLTRTSYKESDKNLST